MIGPLTFQVLFPGEREELADPVPRLPKPTMVVIPCSARR